MPWATLLGDVASGLVRPGWKSPDIPAGLSDKQGSTTMTTTTNDLRNVAGHTAVDANGAKLGKIGRVYVDDRSGQPLWVTISSGMFGMKESFAPLYGSRAEGDTLRLAVSRDLVKGAPGVEAEGRIQHDENKALHTYYAGYLGR
jgi:hypothetical protein